MVTWTLKAIIDNICGGREFIEIGGKKRHAIGYLGDFLFSPDRVRAPTKVLSGGSATDDPRQALHTACQLTGAGRTYEHLDIETLELLEEVLLSSKDHSASQSRQGLYGSRRNKFARHQRVRRD